jgi:hypothetical protein
MTFLPEILTPQAFTSLVPASRLNGADHNAVMKIILLTPLKANSYHFISFISYQFS